jgi:hypothetical protein
MWRTFHRRYIYTRPRIPIQVLLESAKLVVAPYVRSKYSNIFVDSAIISRHFHQVLAPIFAAWWSPMLNMYVIWQYSFSSARIYSVAVIIRVFHTRDGGSTLPGFKFFTPTYIRVTLLFAFFFSFHFLITVKRLPLAQMPTGSGASAARVVPWVDPG